MRSQTLRFSGPICWPTIVSFLHTIMSPFMGSSPSKPRSYEAQAVSLRLACTEVSPSETLVDDLPSELAVCDTGQHQIRHEEWLCKHTSRNCSFDSELSRGEVTTLRRLLPLSLKRDDTRAPASGSALINFFQAMTLSSSASMRRPSQGPICGAISGKLRTQEDHHWYVAIAVSFRSSSLAAVFPALMNCVA